VIFYENPSQFNAEYLVKSKLKIDEDAVIGSVLRAIKEDGEVDGHSGTGDVLADSLSRELGPSYEVLLGDPAESKAYRVLLQAGEDDPGVLKIAPPFTRHIVVAQRPFEAGHLSSPGPSTPPSEGNEDLQSDTELALKRKARHDIARMVVPYSHVPHVEGLQVRFKPLGAGSVPPPPLWSKEGEGEEKRGKSRGSPYLGRDRKAGLTKQEVEGGAVCGKRGLEEVERGEIRVSSKEKRQKSRKESSKRRIV